jgi:hypothetical protein
LHGLGAEDARSEGEEAMRLTEEQYAALQAKSQQFRVEHSKHRPRPNTALISKAAAKKTKFKNIRCQAADGTNFASRLERDYYEQLLLRWKAGDVLWFTRQVPFWLEGGVKFVVDFLIVQPGGVITLADTTGILTQTKRNKLKQLQARYGLHVDIIRKENL